VVGTLACHDERRQTDNLCYWYLYQFNQALTNRAPEHRPTPWRDRACSPAGWRHLGFEPKLWWMCDDPEKWVDCRQ